MQPKVSIIVPVYNVEKWLDRCMQSLLNQTLKDIEIILVDDGSPDRCPMMCDEYAKKDKRVKVVHKRNEGLGLARNSGLDVAIGNYVMFIDSDDHIDLHACLKLYNTAKEYDADMVTGCFLCEDLRGEWHQEGERQISKCIYRKEQIHDYVLDMIACAPYEKIERKHPVSVCLTFSRRSLIEDCHLRFLSEREIASEDTLFKIELLKRVETLVSLPYPFYYYHLNASSLTHSYKPVSFENQNKLRELLIKACGKEEETLLRINRYTASEHRMQILRLISSDCDNKKEYLKKLLHDPIWKELKQFRPSYYPIYSRIFHQLCLWNMPTLVYYYALFIVYLKRIIK